MADDQQAVEEQIVPEAPVPSAEPAPEDAKTEDAPVNADAEAELSEGVSERTREQFNKLKEANKQLKEQLDKKAEVEPIFDSMRPKTETGLTQGQVDQVTDIDPVTGTKFINEQKLNTLLTNSTNQAQQAVKQVNQFIEEQQTQEAFKAIPQLNPNNKEFDPEMHKATRAFILDSMVNPKEYGGRQLSYREAGEMAMKSNRAEIAKVEKEANAQEAAKEQGSLEATGRSDQRANVGTNEDERRQRVRQGDPDALASFFEES